MGDQALTMRGKETDQSPDPKSMSNNAYVEIGIIEGRVDMNGRDAIWTEGANFEPTALFDDFDWNHKDLLSYARHGHPNPNDMAAARSEELAGDKRVIGSASMAHLAARDMKDDRNSLYDSGMSLSKIEMNASQQSTYSKKPSYKAVSCAYVTTPAGLASRVHLHGRKIQRGRRRWTSGQSHPNRDETDVRGTVATEPCMPVI
ncbi:hypothetical protein F5148DRAFT_1150986 [Russula earlei]|uniref:Uncharacterized protein n=1 Tax=Russula earlei TaxID=71964 RepID=A0ACC0U3J4_9AGAM|nr:hypothetical protein F5148DRAFT_1150986 [Russula earlei]